MVSGKLAVGLGAIIVLFAETVHAEAPRSPRPRRDVILEHETHGIPPGFHQETRLRSGPIIGGSITTGVGALMLFAGIDQHRRARADSEGVGIPGGGGEYFMIWGGLSLAVGLPLLAYGLLSPRTVYVRDSVAAVSLNLSAGRRHAGAAATFQF